MTHATRYKCYTRPAQAGYIDGPFWVSTKPNGETGRTSNLACPGINIEGRSLFDAKPTIFGIQHFDTEPAIAKAKHVIRRCHANGARSAAIECRASELQGDHYFAAIAKYMKSLDMDVYPIARPSKGLFWRAAQLSAAFRRSNTYCVIDLPSVYAAFHRQGVTNIEEHMRAIYEGQTLPESVQDEISSIFPVEIHSPIEPGMTYTLFNFEEFALVSSTRLEWTRVIDALFSGLRIFEGELLAGIEEHLPDLVFTGSKHFAPLAEASHYAGWNLSLYSFDPGINALRHAPAFLPTQRTPSATSALYDYTAHYATNHARQLLEGIQRQEEISDPFQLQRYVDAAVTAHPLFLDCISNAFTERSALWTGRSASYGFSTFQYLGIAHLTAAEKDTIIKEGRRAGINAIRGEKLSIAT